ncbi:MAG: hypothetical protein IJ890_09045 [Clostridia bacterium]|nr:hypothetical protein [Clostridia bacterium]
MKINLGAISCLINLYELLPEYASKSQIENEKLVLETKYRLLLCYKYISLEEWEKLQQANNDLKMSFSNIINKRDEYKGKKVNIESANTIISEIENVQEIKDKDIFYIKYKNLMQELNIILEI